MAFVFRGLLCNCLWLEMLFANIIEGWLLFIMLQKVIVRAFVLQASVVASHTCATVNEATKQQGKKLSFSDFSNLLVFYSRCTIDD